MKHKFKVGDILVGPMTGKTYRLEGKNSSVGWKMYRQEDKRKFVSEESNLLRYKEYIIECPYTPSLHQK